MRFLSWNIESSSLLNYNIKEISFLDRNQFNFDKWSGVQKELRARMTFKFSIPIKVIKSFNS